MFRPSSLFLAVLATTTANAETRELGSHQHGISTLDIAVEGTDIAMTLAAPGADIVGFEYQPETDADKAAVDHAIAALADPLALFTPPASAACTVVSATARLILEDDEAHDHEDDHGHDDHAEKEHDHDDDHGHDDHAEKEQDHDEAHDHDEDHAEKASGGHSEFEAEYLLTCSAPKELSQLQFAYFDKFPNAQEIRVQIVGSAGAQAFAVTDQAPSLTLPELY